MYNNPANVRANLLIARKVMVVNRRNRVLFIEHIIP